MYLGFRTVWISSLALVVTSIFSASGSGDEVVLRGLSPHGFCCFGIRFLPQKLVDVWHFRVCLFLETISHYTAHYKPAAASSAFKVAFWLCCMLYNSMLFVY